MKKLIVGFLMAVLLAGCGGTEFGSSSSSTSSSSSSSSSSVAIATVTISASSPQIVSEGSTPATITAYVRDANNQLLTGVTVSFQASSGGLVVTQAVTDSTGAALATLSTAGDPTNRTITVTATAGAISSNMTVDVVGTTLSVTGPTSLVLTGQGTYSVTLLDSSSKAIAGKAVTIASSKANTLNATSLNTDSSGKVTVQLTAVNAGADTLTATSLGLTAQQAVTVSSESFQFTTPTANTNINVGSANAQTVTVKWTSNGSNVADGTAINFATTRGTLSAASAITSGGQASVTIYSNSSGPAVVSATGTGVSTQLNLNFIATTPSTLAIQASPATVATDAQSTITATIRDAAGNLVEGQQVDFTIATGAGSLSLASATSNAQGQAQTVFTAGGTPSGSNGIKVTATVPNTSITTSTYLTVGGQAVFLSLGTGATLSENTDLTKFIQPWVVQAVDSAGNAVNGVDITLTIHSNPSTEGVAYAKGKWIAGTTSWGNNHYAECINEDADLNGQLDLVGGVVGTGEDFNSNGLLEPGDKALTSVGSVTTATDGSAGFTVNYPENYARWVQVKLTATTTVSGTESSTSATYWLPMLAKYANSPTTAIPGEFSPYGEDSNCGDTD